MLYLRAWRLHLGIKTLREFAALTHMNIKTLSRVERDTRSLQLKQITAIAEKLNLSIEDLLKPPPAANAGSATPEKGNISPASDNVSPCRRTPPETMACLTLPCLDGAVWNPHAPVFY